MNQKAKLKKEKENLQRTKKEVTTPKPKLPIDSHLQTITKKKEKKTIKQNVSVKVGATMVCQDGGNNGNNRRTI